jgi:thiol-disulfide isomerase/thioredoxin
LKLLKTKEPLVLALVICLTIPVFVGCGGSSSDQNSNSDMAAKDDVHERFILKNIYGKKYQWSQFIGKPFMINFWATWCGPCRREIPVMIKLYAEYQPLGFEIIAISVDEERTRNQVVPFIDQYKIPWVVLYQDKIVSSEFNLGAGIPTTLFFDAEGNETGRFVGAQPESVFRRELEKLFPK